MTLEDVLEPCISPSLHAAALGSQVPSAPASPHQLRPILSSPVPGSSADPLACSTPRSSSSRLAEGTPARPTTENRAGECVQDPDISRHGLAAPDLARDIQGASPQPTGTPAWPIPKAPSPDTAIGPPAASSGKRPSAADKCATQPLGSPTKKPRLVAPGNLSLPPFPEIWDQRDSSPNPVMSPLFFSKSPKPPMNRLSSFPSVDAARSMMGGQENASRVTTLRLPKAQVSAASPPRSSGSPGSWSPTELSSLSRSPDGWPPPSTIQLLQGIGVVELLEQDDRPTFVIDLNDPANFRSGPLHMMFANAALRTAPGVLGLLQQDTAASGHNPEFPGFRAWAVSLVREKEGQYVAAPTVTYAGLLWTSSTLRRRFRIIRGSGFTASATPTSPSPAPQRSPAADQKMNGAWPVDGPRERNDYFGQPIDGHVRAHSEPRRRPEPIPDAVVRPFDDLALATPLLPQLQTTFDWTRIPADEPSLSAHHQFARSIDWGSTPLGPVESWPPELRIMTNMIMGSPHPAALYWGKDYVAIYNEAYISLAGQKHPQLMGSRYRDIWPEIWDEIEPVFESAWNEGRATMKYDDCLFITRHGFLEETFFNWAIIPLVGGDGTVVALYNPAFDNTLRRINERRMLTLREIGITTSQARDVKSFWEQLQKGLEYNEFDVPFALIYSVGEDVESEVSSMNSGSLSNPPQIVLEGSVGVPQGHPCAIMSIDLRRSEEGFAPYMRESMAQSASPVILSEEDGTLPAGLLQGLSWRGFGDSCRTVVVFPVHPTTAGDMVVGFIVLGVNPRRHYDGDYQLFISLLSRQLATSLASVVLFEEEIKRGQRAARLAALDRQELSLQLHLRTQEAVESEYRFARMAEFGPVGLFIADSNGHINYCNEMWYKISGLDRTTTTLDAWMHSIRDEDRLGAESAWRRLVEEKRAVTHEFRFKGSRELIDGHSVDIWALLSAYPEKDEAGELKSIFGCITDISQQKWAEAFQKQRREEAVEMKRQQENFIDITSHEMRNPLSAILQCADEISSSLARYKQGSALAQAQAPAALSLLVDSCIEAAGTISLCANHQKRIVDDILTLSKLDSNLLLVTPVDVQPVKVVQEVLKIFEAELISNGIEGQFCVEQSYRDLAIDWVKLDPSRLRQVLINLMTNAIKFTQGRPTRSIVVSLGASKDVAVDGQSYIPPRHPNQGDITDDADWADGEKTNLHLAVSDTGPGLDENEKKTLFQRFSQTSPRTHVQYGGSGLGLFICRILTELQGGQIGVHSQKGLGSTFFFYIKSRKSHPPLTVSPAGTSTPNNVPPSPLRIVPPMQSQSIIASPATSATEPIHKQPVLSSPTRGCNVKRLDVLIVEDNLVNQKVLQRQLQIFGNNTYVANHGGEALAAIRRSRFWNESAAVQNRPFWLSSMDTEPGGCGDGEDIPNISVILMDLEMPVMDGMSCTREIRRLEQEGLITRHIPIIAVTAYARPEQVESAKAAGVDDVISKPFRIPELIPKIEELVEKYTIPSWP
ncbi:Histidine protein kinase NIK1 [Madurella fahalii]|uniref:Histidine protein kinase NIK1 n=1 Tax=Madurella fahalii TaxID=1157608 RepID=A0ABQ0FX02_9PEZI